MVCLSKFFKAVLEICEFINTYFEEHLRTNASEICLTYRVLWLGGFGNLSASKRITL